ncbi:hypothetical protein FOZ63_024864 [Perkinsus olseni]|uniref:Uncharacterized protein n=1 Tax=Perkinsus olseni TaxID=32597 RepID=A0A7J6RJ40_PEROL|nr:hypothetical protein FOZ63_024864 [Perkinsus olseni]
MRASAAAVAAFIPQLPLSHAIGATNLPADDFPHRNPTTTRFDLMNSTAVCSYHNGDYASNHTASLFIRVGEKSMQTDYVQCPATKARSSFSLGYWGHPAVRSHAFHRPHTVDTHRYPQGPPPNEGLDPLRKLDQSGLRQELKGLFKAATRVSHGLTPDNAAIFETFMDREPPARQRVAEHLQSVCSAELTAIKRYFVSLRKLCDEYYTAYRAAKNAAEREGWVSKEYLPGHYEVVPWWWASQ